MRPPPGFWALLLLLSLAPGAAARGKLKWAHVYETSEPFHRAAVSASEELEKRSNGKFRIEVFPASSLGKESDITQGLSLGTIEIITSGVAFAARRYPRLGISYYPFLSRDADHLLAYAKSDVFREIAQGFREKTGVAILAYTYYGHAPRERRAAVYGLREHGRLEDPRAGRGRLQRDAAGVWGDPDPHRFRRGVPGIAEPHRRRAREPLDHHVGEEVLRGTEPHHAHGPRGRASTRCTSVSSWCST